MAYVYAAGALFAADIVLHVAAIVARKETLRCFTKVLLMPLLTFVFALIWARVSLSPLPLFVALGLLAGSAGDICLLDHTHPPGVLLGLLFFSIGHVLYLIQLFALMTPPTWWLVAAAAAVYASGAALTYKSLFPYLPGQMRVPALAYMLLLCTFSASAAVYALSSLSAGAFVLLGGTLLFLLSDTVLSFEIFRGETKLSHAKVMTPYIAAQVLIAAGFVIQMA
jgi:uncharacterized membrane protein YhhN